MANKESVIKVQVGSFEGHPVNSSLSDEEVQEMLDAGLSMDDIRDIASIPPDSLTWQRDC